MLGAVAEFSPINIGSRGVNTRVRIQFPTPFFSFIKTKKGRFAKLNARSADRGAASGFDKSVLFLTTAMRSSRRVLHIPRATAFIRFRVREKTIKTAYKRGSPRLFNERAREHEFNMQSVAVNCFPRARYSNRVVCDFFVGKVGEGIYTCVRLVIPKHAKRRTYVTNDYVSAKNSDTHVYRIVHAVYCRLFTVRSFISGE